MGYGNGKSYLDNWDDWEKHNRLKNGDTSGYSGKAEVVTYTGKSSSKKDTYYTSGERCYHKHPALKLPNSELTINGGSCSSPIVKDADIYIGFDDSMHFTERCWPWKKGTEFLFKIRDMSVPDKPDEFKKLVTWTIGQLKEGKKIHCGCIGGHGRTGTFLAAVCSEMGEKDAITYVRKNYCHKAVESSGQVNFLNEHFGITKVEGHKSNPPKTNYSTKGGKSSSGASKSYTASNTFTPVPGNGCIWDAPA